MSSPRSVINESFFEQLWPLILREDVCKTYLKDDLPYFVPKRPFDNLWAHGLLASKNYGQYETPICFYVPPCASSEESIDDMTATRTEIEIDTEKHDGECKNLNQLLRLDEQFRELCKQEQRRNKLVEDFKNRTVPWHVSVIALEKEFTYDLQRVFTKPMERNLLNAIQNFECKFMIINVGASSCFSYIESWLKFCKYVKIVLIVRKEEIATKLSRISTAIYPVIFEDIFENTWQEELTRALNAGVTHAENVNIMTNCAMAFPYVFSSRCDSDCFNKYQILRKI